MDNSDARALIDAIKDPERALGLIEQRLQIPFAPIPRGDTELLCKGYRELKAKLAKAEADKARLLEAYANVRMMIGAAVEMVESELSPERAKLFSGVDPMAVVAELYGRFAPMCQELDAGLVKEMEGK